MLRLAARHQSLPGLAAAASPSCHFSSLFSPSSSDVASHHSPRSAHLHTAASSCSSTSFPSSYLSSSAPSLVFKAHFGAKAKDNKGEKDKPKKEVKKPVANSNKPEWTGPVGQKAPGHAINPNYKKPFVSAGKYDMETLKKDVFEFLRWRAQDPLRIDYKTQQERDDWIKNAPISMEKLIDKDILYEHDLLRWREQQLILQAGGNPYQIKPDGSLVAEVPQKPDEPVTTYLDDLLAGLDLSTFAEQDRKEIKDYVDALKFQHEQFKAASEEAFLEQDNKKLEAEKNAKIQAFIEEHEVSYEEAEEEVGKDFDTQQKMTDNVLKRRPDIAEDVKMREDDRPNEMLQPWERQARQDWKLKKRLEENRREWARVGDIKQIEEYFRQRRKEILENPTKFHPGEAVHDPFIKRRDQVLEQVAKETKEEVGWDVYDQPVRGDQYPGTEENFDMLQKYLHQADHDFFGGSYEDMWMEKLEKSNVRTKTGQYYYDKWVLNKTNAQLNKDLADLRLFPEGMTDGVFIMRKIRTMKSLKGQIVNLTQICAVGNEKGTAAYAIGKSGDPDTLNDKTLQSLKRNVLTIGLHEGRTIFHPSKGVHGATKVYLEPRNRGFGITASPLLRTLLGLFGVRDCGTGTVCTEFFEPQLFALWDALSQQVPHRQIAENRGVNYYSLEAGVKQVPLPTHEQMREKHNTIKGIVVEALNDMDQRKGINNRWSTAMSSEDIHEGIWESIHSPDPRDEWPIFNRGQYTDQGRAATPPFVPRPAPRMKDY